MRTIIIGLGNMDRADDGAGREIINLLRTERGLESLDDTHAGIEPLSENTDVLCLMQLAPEIMETLVHYERVVFVDAHAAENMDDLHCARIHPDYVQSTFTHHMTPSSLLAFLQILYGHEPEASLLSVRGHDFDFKRGLSPATGSLLPAAVARIMDMAGP